MAIKQYYAYPKDANNRFRAMRFTDDTHVAEFFSKLNLDIKYTQVPDGVILIENGETIEFNYGDWLLIYQNDFIILDDEDFIRMFRTKEVPNA